MAIIEIDGDLFDDETGEYAGQAGGGYLLKTKTYRCPFGTLSQRTTQSTVKVSKPDVALAYLKRECPAAVKVQESVLISAIPADLKKVLIDDSVMAEGLGFDVIPGGESITIKTIMESKNETE